MMQVPDTENVINRLQSQKGVLGVIVATNDGMPIHTTLDNTATVLYIGGLQTLQERCESLVREIDPTDELEFLRITTNRFEIMMAQRDDHLAVVVQKVALGKEKRS